MGEVIDLMEFSEEAEVLFSLTVRVQNTTPLNQFRGEAQS
jgi:hypothetical protein